MLLLYHCMMSEWNKHNSLNIFFFLFSEDQDANRDPNILVVDGVAVPLPSYEEAVSGTYCHPPSDLPPARLGSAQHSEEQNPPSYPGYSGRENGVPLDTSEVETCDSISDTSEYLQGIQPSSSHGGGLNNISEKTNAITSMEETASTSPSIDIADGKVINCCHLVV